MTEIDQISHYLKFHSRNKIVFHRDEIPYISPINIGLRISEAIYKLKGTGRISLRVTAELDNILSHAISENDLFGRYLSIENLGILFESELKLDFSRIIDSYSQNNVLFVKWDGEIDDEHLYFLTKENGLKINIKNLSHIAI